MNLEFIADIKPDRQRFGLSLIVLCFLFALTNCGHEKQWEKEYANLLQQTIALEQQHAQLERGIDNLWDTTAVQLVHALPASFPAIDRDIFLKARNADHIRMFMSFKLLDSSTQALVVDAGKQDQLLAAQLHTLQEQKQTLEHRKIQFLQAVERQDSTAGRRYAAQMRMASNH